MPNLASNEQCLVGAIAYWKLVSTKEALDQMLNQKSNNYVCEASEIWTTEKLHMQKDM